MIIIKVHYKKFILKQKKKNWNHYFKIIVNINYEEKKNEK